MNTFADATKAFTGTSNVQPTLLGLAAFELKREHQTCVLIDIGHVSINDEHYVERVHRFAYSFNHNQTIKADVYLWAHHKIVPYALWKDKNLGPLIKSRDDAPRLDFDAAQRWAKERGYRLCVIATPSGRKAE